MKVGKQAYVLGVGPVVVLEFGKGPTARVRLWGKAKELEVEKTKLVAKAPKGARVGDKRKGEP